MQHVFDRGQGIITFQGSLTEADSFDDLAKELQGRVVFDLEQVTRINSSGVRQWIRFMMAVPGSVELHFRNCSPCFVAQLNMISNFAGPATVASLVVPFLCPSCGAETERVFTAGDLARGDPPAPACAKCGKATELDVIADEYFSFVKAASQRQAPLP